jgi:threonine aldolase
MRKAMAAAEVGDEGYSDDPTVKKLEALAAEKTGKEASVFCVSGTLANLIGIMCWTEHGDEVICEEESHLYWYENAGMALLPAVQPVLLKGDRFRTLEPATLKAALKPVTTGPSRRLLELENTHNRASGTVMSIERTNELCKIAHDNGMKVHLDGARLFNAAVALNAPASKLVENIDSLMFCLSKGMGAPMGSMLCGSKEFIDKARKLRKAVGGGLRQVGVVAAAGYVGLSTMVDRLGEDHKNARVLAEALAEIPGIDIDLEAVQTNLVCYEVNRTGVDAPTMVKLLLAEGVKCTAHNVNRIRMVVSKEVTTEDMKETARIMKKIVAGIKK